LRELHYEESASGAPKYVAEDDDLASALRYAVMDMRFARTLGEIEARAMTARQPQRATLDANAGDQYFGIDA
jgi:hypothetical protein